MSKKRPNNLIAPIVIAGITAGFFFSTYRFVFAKLKQTGEPVKLAYSVDQSKEEGNKNS